MNTISTSLVSLLLVLAASPLTMAVAQDNAADAAESKCMIEAEDKAIAEDKYDDYVSNCIEKAMSSK